MSKHFRSEYYHKFHEWLDSRWLVPYLEEDFATMKGLIPIMATVQKEGSHCVGISRIKWKCQYIDSSCGHLCTEIVIMASEGVCTGTSKGPTTDICTVITVALSNCNLCWITPHQLIKSHCGKILELSAPWQFTGSMRFFSYSFHSCKM